MDPEPYEDEVDVVHSHQPNGIASSSATIPRAMSVDADSGPGYRENADAGTVRSMASLSCDATSVMLT